MLAHAPSLADIARSVAQGLADSRQLHEAFLAAVLYCERGADPGFKAIGVPHAGVVPVFSSVEQLALARGTVPWFALSGTDLLDQLPPGYDVMLDIAGATPLRLRTSALRTRPAVTLRTVT